MTVRILDRDPNPALGELLAEVRSVERQGDRHRFRGALRTLGVILAHETGKHLPRHRRNVPTPLGESEVDGHAVPPVVGTALRAGLPFFDGFLEVYRDADTMIFGAARREGAGPAEDLSMKVELDYAAVAPCDGRVVLFVDPMIATGSTVVDVHRAIRERGMQPGAFFVCGLVGFSGAVERIMNTLPNASVFLITCDDELDDRGYIVPGLGDAGDLAYGPKC